MVKSTLHPIIVSNANEGNMGSSSFDGTSPGVTGRGAIINPERSRHEWPRDDVAGSSY
jgi:hypothetical protein